MSHNMSMASLNTCKVLIPWRQTYKPAQDVESSVMTQDLFLILKSLLSSTEPKPHLPPIKIIAPITQLSPFSPAYSFLPPPLTLIYSLPIFTVLDKSTGPAERSSAVPDAYIRTDEEKLEIEKEVEAIMDREEMANSELRFIWVTQPIEEITTSGDMSQMEKVGCFVEIDGSRNLWAAVEGGSTLFETDVGDVEVVMEPEAGVGPPTEDIDQDGDVGDVGEVAASEAGAGAVEGGKGKEGKERRSEEGVMGETRDVELVGEVQASAQGAEKQEMELGPSEAIVTPSTSDIGRNALECPSSVNIISPISAITNSNNNHLETTIPSLSAPVELTAILPQSPVGPTTIEVVHGPLSPAPAITADITPDTIAAKVTSLQSIHPSDPIENPAQNVVIESCTSAPVESSVCAPETSDHISSTDIEISEALPAAHEPSTPSHPSTQTGPQDTPLSDPLTVEEAQEETHYIESPIPISPILPRPKFASLATPAPTLSRSLKRKDTMEDLFSTLIPTKRKKVELVPIRKDPVEVELPQADIIEPDLANDAPDEPDCHSDDTSAPMEQPMPEAPPSEDESECPEDAQKDQWRVGRLPGHQGSHIRRRDVGDGVNGLEKEVGSRGKKRSLGQSITDSAEKVLKKPFRLPARVILKSSLKPTRPQSVSPPPSTPSPPSYASLADGPASSPLKSDSGPTTDTYSPGPKPTAPSTRINSRPFAVPRKIAKPVFSELFPNTPRTGNIISAVQTPSTPVSKATSATSSSTATDTASSPFKPSPTYSKRLSKPFKPPFSRSTAPSPASASVGSARAKAKNTRDLIMELEKEERTLRNAIKYHTQPEEDERLVELIQIWREAGQQTADLLFGVQAKPEAGAAGVGGMGGSMFGGDSGGQSSFFFEVDYTPEQQRQLARMRRDGNGDPIDDEGNPIFGGGAREGGQGVSEDTSEGKGQENEDGDGSVAKAAASDEWTIGTMLARMGVDPVMYAWDADAEDWGVPEED